MCVLCLTDMCVRVAGVLGGREEVRGRKFPDLPDLSVDASVPRRCDSCIIGKNDSGAF